VSTNKKPKPRKAGQPVHPEPKSRLKLLKPQSECSTTGLVAELSEEVKAMLRGQKRRRDVGADEDSPEAA
jgi:hypothetical protein